MPRWPLLWRACLQGGGEFVDGDADPLVRPVLGAQFVMPAAKVVYECVPGRYDFQRASAFDATHRPQPCFEPVRCQNVRSAVRLFCPLSPMACQRVWRLT